MKSKLCFILLGVSMLCGCVATVRLYPVQGPLAAQTPAPVLVGRITGAFNSGNISVVLNDGEVCKGRWVQVPRPEASRSASGAAPATTKDMSADWDTIYGPGFYVSHVLGARLYARAVLSGNRGTTLNVELYRPEGENGAAPGTVKGVAQDDKDNVYKLTF